MIDALIGGRELGTHELADADQRSVAADEAQALQALEMGACRTVET